jgi:hypothetical protein
MDTILAILMALWAVVLLIGTDVRKHLRHQDFLAWSSVGVMTVFAILWAIAGYLVVTFACFMAMGVCALWGLAAERARSRFWQQQQSARPWSDI